MEKPESEELLSAARVDGNSSIYRGSTIKIKVSFITDLESVPFIKDVTSEEMHHLSRAWNRNRCTICHTSGMGGNYTIYQGYEI